jgi:signal transduction histidine kinase
MNGRRHGGARAPAEKPLIALVEDDADIRETVAESLDDGGYRVVSFVDGAQALAALSSADEVPSLILLDLMMPGMDGWSFRLRQRELPKLREVPVIVMSANATPQAAAIDADAYLPKPLHLERLFSSVEHVLTGVERRKLLARSLEFERLRVLGMLVSSIAHEVNNPLAYASGNLDLALRDCERLMHAHPEASALADTLRGRVDAARHGNQRIAEIVKDLLTFARAEAHEGRAVVAADVGVALDAAVRLVEASIAPKAQLVRHVPPLPKVVGHGARLAQVFLNLLVNAGQAIVEGQPRRNTVEVSASTDGEHVIVEVSDTGRGIAPEHLGRIFEPFFTTKPAGEGTGIGLSFCQEVVESFGGQISVRSTFGKGTTFRVELLAASADA